MPMECHVSRTPLVGEVKLTAGAPATSAASWSLASWPFMPADMRERMEADENKPKASERLYSRDGKLVVAAGMPLPDNADELLTEAQVLGTDEPVAAPEVPEPRHRTRNRRK